MPDNADDLVRLEQRDGVAVVTLNDPARRNIFSGPLVRALGDAMDRAEGHEVTRCAVVTGAGLAFCAGAELATLRGAADGAFDVDAAVALGQRLAKQEKAYVRRLTATLRGALSTPEHADALAQETAAQRWSAGRPAFREGVQAIEDRIARRS